MAPIAWTLRDAELLGLPPHAAVRGGRDCRCEDCTAEEREPELCPCCLRVPAECADARPCLDCGDTTTPYMSRAPGYCPGCAKAEEVRHG